MSSFRLSIAVMCIGALFLLAACQQVTRQPEVLTLVEHNIPTFQAHAGGIKADADGALWFAETGTNQIARIAMDGTVTEYPVPTEDAIDDSQGFVGLGPDGAIWFNEDLVNKLGRITPDGTITEFDLPEGTGGVREMVAGPDGNLWVTASFVNKIYKLSTDGELLAEYTVPTADSRPVGMVLGPDNAFWFTKAGANQIGRISLDGEVTEYPLPEENSFPLRITTGPDGALWFALRNAHKVGRISTDGQITTFEAGMGPVGIAAGSDGALWFTGYETTAVGRLTPDGVLTQVEVPTYASIPYHIVAGPDGNLWFTEQQGNKIGQIILPAAMAGAPASAGEQEPAAGRTTFSPGGYKLPLALSFGPEWEVTDNLPDLVTVENKQEGFGLAFNIVTEASLADPVDGHLIPFPEDFLAWIKADPDFAAVTSMPVTVGGVSGLQIDATPIWTSTTANKKPLLTLPGNGWNLIPAPEQWRFILLDPINGERVLILLLAPAEKFQRVLPEAQKVLDTVAFSAPTAVVPTSAATQAPATFAPTRFKLPMTFALGPEWKITEDYPDVVTLVMQPDIVDTGFITVKGARIAGPAAPFSTAPFPEDFATWIEAHGLFRVVATQPVTVGGFPGTQTDAIGTAACGHRRNWIFPSTGTGWNCTEGQYFRFSYFPDVYGEPILILNTGARTDDKAAEEFRLGTEASQRVLDTIEFSAP